MKTLENILTEGFAEMEVGLREVELGIAYSKTKEALALVKIASRNFALPRKGIMKSQKCQSKKLI